ncbi:MAG: aldo/keto reductase [Acidimicrobiia bacterium]
MLYRSVGSLEVSVIGVGCNQFGPSADRETTAAIVDRALEAGVNFFDTADEYGPEGVSEEYLGQAIRGRRDRVIVASKFGHHMHGDPERGGASARWIARAVEDSLRRLDTDYIDLYQQHFPDPAVTADETLGALERLVRDGKVREIGCCNLSATDLDERAALAAANGWRPLVTAQNRLNLLRQEALDTLVPAIERTGMSLLPFFPLANGILTGKYRAGHAPPSGTRFADHVEPAQARRMIDRDAPRVEALRAWAEERGHTVAELALAWLSSQPFVASVIAGVTKPAQIEANAQAAAWGLTAEEIAEVAAIARGGSLS